MRKKNNMSGKIHTCVYNNILKQTNMGKFADIKRFIKFKFATKWRHTKRVDSKFDCKYCEDCKEYNCDRDCEDFVIKVIKFATKCPRIKRVIETYFENPDGIPVEAYD